MIFTGCPYCNAPRIFSYDRNFGGNWVTNLCRDCNKVMWFHNTCVPGGQTITYEMMLEKFPERIEEINKLKDIAKDLCLIYNKK